MNFQSFDNKKFNITEIDQLSHTLSRMSQALSSHFTSNEESQISLAIRNQTLADKLIAPIGYQIEILNWLNPGSYGETYDSVCENATDLETKVGYLLLDSSEIMLDAGIKNTYIKAVFNTCIHQSCELTKIAYRINNELKTKLKLPAPLQLWMATIDPKTNTLNHLNLGTNTVLYYSSHKHEIIQLEQHPFVFLSEQKRNIQPQSLNIQAGDIIIVASDGITGALNKERIAFGKKTLENIILENHQESTRDIHNILSKQFIEFIGKNILEDDRTIIIFKYEPKCN